MEDFLKIYEQYKLKTDELIAAQKSASEEGAWMSLGETIRRLDIAIALGKECAELCSKLAEMAGAIAAIEEEKERIAVNPAIPPLDTRQQMAITLRGVFQRHGFIIPPHVIDDAVRDVHVALGVNLNTSA